MKNGMYTVIKSCIERGEFKLGEIIPRIREESFSGLISESERDELIELAHEKVNPSNEAPDVMLIIENVIKRLDEVEAILKQLIAPEQPEGSENPEETPEDPTEPSESEQPVYPVWEPWDGMSKNYQKGDIVIHNDELWESTFEGQNVWEPGTPGIDDRYWTKYIAE